MTTSTSTNHDNNTTSAVALSNNKNKNRHNNNNKYDTMITKLQKGRQLCGDIVNDSRVQIIIIIMIVVNALMMGIGTYSFIEDNLQLSNIWDTTDMIFLIIFTIELGLQFIYHGYQLLYDGWLMFDTIIISMSWLLNDLQIIRALRIFRTLRVLTRLKPLRNLISSLFDVLPSMTAIVMLLLLIMYIYAVLCTVLFGSLYKDGITDIDYFSRLDISFFTLFQMMTLEWSYIVRVVCTVYPYAWVIFMSFVIFAAFILYSLIVAVVCDAVAVTERNSKEHGENDNTKKISDEQNIRMKLIQDRIYDITYQQSLLIRYIEQHHKQQQRSVVDTSNNNIQSIFPWMSQRKLPRNCYSHIADDKHSNNDTSETIRRSSSSKHNRSTTTFDPDLDEYMSVTDSHDEEHSFNHESDCLSALFKKRLETDDIDAYMDGRESISSSFSTTKKSNQPQQIDKTTTNNKESSRKRSTSRSIHMMKHVLLRKSSSMKGELFLDASENDFYQKQQERLLSYRQRLNTSKVK